MIRPLFIMNRQQCLRSMVTKITSRTIGVEMAIEILQEDSGQENLSIRDILLCISDIIFQRGSVIATSICFWLSLAEVITKYSHSSFAISRTLKERCQRILAKRKRKEVGLWSFFDNIVVKSFKIIHRGRPKKFKDIPLYLRVILTENYLRAFYHSNLFLES